MKEVKIGILGLGNVGTGVVEGIEKNGLLMAERIGLKPVIKKIADKNLIRKRRIDVPKSLLTEDAAEVVADEQIDLIVELIGGTDAARNLTLAALNRRKPVITANKALLAEHGAEIYRTARKNETGIYYEAAVGGGIPVLRAVGAGLIGNQIERIYGILNGTCNYILTRMEHEELPFEKVLENAKKLGYAEKNPDLDINGIDTVHKAVVLASMAYGAPVSMKACPVRGINGLQREEITCADELGYRIKLLAIIKEHDGQVEMSVEPTLVPKRHMMALISDNFNAVFVKGDLVGDTMYYGLGAGGRPTASAVIGDIAEAAADKLHGAGTPRSVTMMLRKKTLDYCPAEHIEKRCYIRLCLEDRPGAMAKVMEIFGRCQISIASLVQKEQYERGCAPVVILTQTARESAFAAAMKEVNALDISCRKPIRMRLEDFKDLVQ